MKRNRFASLVVWVTLTLTAAQSWAQTTEGQTSAPTPTPTALQNVIVEVEGEMGIPPGQMPVPSAQCAEGGGFICIDLDIPGGVPMAVRSVEGVTEDQMTQAVSAAECRINHRQEIMARAFTRLARRVQVGEISESTFLGIAGDATPDQRLAAANYWGRYLRVTVPAEFQRQGYEILSGDAAVRADFQEGLRQLRGHVDTEVTRLEGLITTERTRATGEEHRIEGLNTAEVARATNAENGLRGDVDSARRHRVTLGPYASFLRLAGPLPGPAWNGGGIGFFLMGRPLDVPLVIGTRLTLSYGETEAVNGRGAFGFFIEALGGYEWSNGRVLGGAVAGMLVSSRWHETIMMMGLGPMGRVEFNPTRAIAIGAYIGGIFGNAVDPNTGKSFDTSRYMLGVDIGFHLGNW